MTRKREPIQEIDLLAYADGLLDSDIARKEEVERHLSAHPEAADHVAEIREQNEAIRDHFGGFPADPVPEHLTAVLHSEPRHPHRKPVLQATVVFVLVLASTAGGWLIGQYDQDEPWGLGGFVERAATFHDASPATMASPAADAGSGLQPLGWLNHRIALELAAPNLAAEGFVLVAKDRLGPEDDPMVRLVYKRADDTTINLFLRPRWEEAGDQFAKSEREGVAVRYWLDGPLAFAMTTDADNPESDHLARIVREAIDRARLKEETPAMALTPEAPAPAMSGAENDRTLIPGPDPATTPREKDRQQLKVN